MKPARFPLLFVLFSLIPPVHLGAVLWLGVNWVMQPSWASAGWVLFAIYLAPLLIYRLTALVWPIRLGAMGVADLSSGPWLFAIKLQMLFITFPALERVLILVPELFNLWLRLWGSKIGKMVFWSSDTTVLDRTHLRIGNHVFFGHAVTLSCHSVRMKDDQAQLYFQPIQMGDRVFVGGFTKILPGAQIATGSRLDLGAVIGPNANVK